VKRHEKFADTLSVVSCHVPLVIDYRIVAERLWLPQTTAVVIFSNSGCSLT